MTTCSSNPAGTFSEEGKVYLFDPQKLKTLSKWSVLERKLDERKVRARPLELSDYNLGYLELLSQLTKVGEISKSRFEKRFMEMKRKNEGEDHYAIVVIEDLETGRVVGASTLKLEYKFIHNCALLGGLEEVAILESHRGRQLGELVVSIIVELAKETYKCYKLVLSCKDSLIDFYVKSGFKNEANMMCIRF